MSASVSVVVVTYRRMKNLERILLAWLAMTPDVWLADSSEAFSTKLPINHVRFRPDPGNRSRHAVASLTHGDFVILADDDILPKTGLIQDFLNQFRSLEEFGLPILGLIGRRFLGPRYYGETEFARASVLSHPREVDFVGVTTFVPRHYIGWDARECETAIEDLYWQMKLFPLAPKYVAATKNYENLPECSDEGNLFHNPKARLIRETFYARLFNEHYRNRVSRWKR